ncbi:NAD(+) diphosphatase [Cribrihabitans neustonicus]|uniref:NAD(+) diphosphatase n=1 Tax=Cribrihabitans neustonicus TaxID=1429085 RepID=UPI003B5BC7C1
MKRAELVTFGGGGLQRDAHLRGDAAALKAAWQHPDAAVLPLWRGQPLICPPAPGGGSAALAWVSPIHPLAEAAREEALFLGRTPGGAPRFACTLSGWQPEVTAENTPGSFGPQHPELPQGQVFADLRQVMALLPALDAEIAAAAKALLSWHRSHRFCAACGAPSQVAQAGWQRLCPVCETPHFPRTDPVVIMLITHGDDVLVGRSPGWPEGVYSLLAGFVEPGETLEAAVRRETYEECGVEVGAVRYLSSQPWPFPMSLMFGCAGEALGQAITLDRNEIEDARWVSRQEMMQVHAGFHPDMKPAREGAIAHFLIKNWLADTLD